MNTFSTSDDNPRKRYFNFPKDVQLHGGFAGTETTLQTRVTGLVSTISGDIGVEGVNSDNCYRLFVASNAVNNSGIIDNFVLTGANANGTDSDQIDYHIFNYNGNPSSFPVDLASGAVFFTTSVHNIKFQSCVIQNNTARYSIIFSDRYGSSTDSLELLNCNINNNTLLEENFNYLIFYYSDNSRLKIENSTFSDQNCGGVSFQGQFELINSTFQNMNVGDSPVLRLSESSCLIDKCSFLNISTYFYIVELNSPGAKNSSIKNSIFRNNKRLVSDLYSNSGFLVYGFFTDVLNIENSLFANNEAFSESDLVSCYFGVANFKNCTIVNNKSVNEYQNTIISSEANFDN